MSLESSRSPVSAWAARLVPLFVLVLFLVPFAWTSSFNTDEFTNMSQALRVMRGEVMYRDFFELIAPLSFWLLALVYKLFGASLAVTNIFQALIVALTAWQTRALARQLGVGPWVSWLPAFILVMGLYPHWPGYSHHWVALPLVLAALQLGVKSLAEPHWKWWAPAGLACGLTTLTLHSDGLVLLITLLGFVGLYAVLGGSTPRDAGWAAAGLFGGFVATLAVGAGFLASQGALAAAWDNVWVWTFKNYQVEGGLNHHPPLTDLPTILSPVKEVPGWYGRVYHFLTLFGFTLGTAGFALAWGLGLLWRRTRRGPGVSREEAELGLVAMAALAFVALALRGRADFIHVAFYAVPAALLATLLAHRWAVRSTSDEGVLLRWVPLGALATFALTGALMFVKGAVSHPEVWLSSASPDARVTQAPVLQYLKANARPGDLVAAAPYGGYYYFYGPRPASRFSHMFPPAFGFTPKEDFQTFAHELATRRPAFIVVAPWGWGDEANIQDTYRKVIPQDYTLATKLKTGQWGGGWPAYVYRRED